MTESDSVAKSLVIVESPAKAKTIMKFLGRGHTVKASMGHIRDLPKSKLGVKENGKFTPTYQVLPGRKKVIDELKKSAEGVDAVYLAADPDREGEAICWHLAEELKKVNKTIHRVLFNEITKRAVTEAIQKPGKIDQDKVDAQQARRILDRLVGYKISPLLWEKVRRGLSAGRVQSVALRMICDREKEREAFKPVEYWSLAALLAAAVPPEFEARLTKRDGNKFDVGSEKDMKEVLAGLKGASFKVEDVKAREKRRNPLPPFITSRLQTDASRRLGFTVRKTMMIAQSLYEGKELGDLGTVGLITYMRTDSTRIADEALAAARQYIAATYGEKNLPEKPRVYASRKGAQDAHEAIRPTSMDYAPDTVRKFLSKDEDRLYTLIWNRFVASQMESAVFDTTAAEISAGRYTFRATGSVMKFQGFLAVYDDAPAPKKNAEEVSETPADEDSEGAGKNLPPLETGMNLKLVRPLKGEQHFTQPPPRYGEAMLVKALEENGIGRPSTYASILGTLQARDYVQKEKGRFVPSELGRVVTDLLVESFGDIVEVGYTARLEEELDQIEEGHLEWVRALQEFNEKFTKDLEKAATEMRNVKTEEIPTDSTCDKCGKPMVIKWGRYGRFMACSGYPECRNTQELAGGENGDAAPPEINEECPKCGKPMVLRRGRFGPFLACSGYPDCKTTRKIQVTESGAIEAKKERVLDEECPKCGQKLVVKHGRFGEFTACSNYPDCRYIKLKEVGVPCPKDGGAIVERRSKRGRTFYGCANYPDCDFVVWKKPIPRACPKCKAPYLLENRTKREGDFLFCGNDECDFKEHLETASASS